MANDAREKLAGILRLNTDELARDVTRANEILASIGKGKDIGSQIAQNISEQIKKGIENGIKDAKIPDIGSVSSGGSGGRSSGSKVSDTSLLSSQLQQTKQIYQMQSLMNKAGEAEKANLEEKIRLSNGYLDDQKNTSKFNDDELQTLQDVVKIQEKENALLTEQVKQRQRVASEADKLLKATLAAQQKEVGKSSKEAQKKSEADIAQLLTQQVRLTKEKAAAEAKVLLTNGEQKNVYEQIAGRKETELEAVKKDIDARIKANNELSKSKAYIEGNEKVKRAEAEATDTVAKAEAKAADNAEKQNKAQLARTTLMDKIQASLTHIVIQAATRALTQFWQEAWKYASEYYDKMNEIRIVTGKTEQESAAIGTSLRNLAREMSVSSKEMAEGAITFYRQGLGDDEVNKRLIATTEYAKTAGLSFEQSADMITATVNTIEKDGRGMEMTAQRVADVFLYLGDNAATSGKQHCPIAA